MLCLECITNDNNYLSLPTENNSTKQNIMNSINIKNNQSKSYANRNVISRYSKG